MWSSSSRERTTNSVFDSRRRCRRLPRRRTMKWRQPSVTVSEQRVRSHRSNNIQRLSGRMSMSTGSSRTAETSLSALPIVRGGTVLDSREFHWEGIGEYDPIGVLALSSFSVLRRHVVFPERDPHSLRCRRKTLESLIVAQRPPASDDPYSSAWIVRKKTSDCPGQCPAESCPALPESARSRRAMIALAKVLDLEKRPAYIECFDICTSRARRPMCPAPFVTGSPNKSQYRLFKIEQGLPMISLPLPRPYFEG